MKILLTGANGMLGTDLKAALSFEDVVAVGKNELNISDFPSVLETVRRIKPDKIINAAAYTNVDGCETETELAYAVNAGGAKNLAVAAREIGAVLLHVSTDYVFDGLKGTAYIETDETNPLGVYGKSKLMGEEHIKSESEKFFIVRTQWLYGKHGNNFVKTICKLAKERGQLKVVNDQVGRPTFTKDLSSAIAELIKTEDYGLYHLTNSGDASWYDFTEEILNAAGIQAELSPCTTEEFPRPAKRPAYAPLQNKKWLETGHKALRGYEDALREYFL